MLLLLAVVQGFLALSLQPARGEHRWARSSSARRSREAPPPRVAVAAATSRRGDAKHAANAWRPPDVSVALIQAVLQVWLVGFLLLASLSSIVSKFRGILRDVLLVFLLPQHMLAFISSSFINMDQR